ncbi:hypothetical protein FKM82_028488 [Ascaphus truei]
MNSFICTLAIFMALMAAGHCNKCKQCWSLNTKECCDEKETDCGTSGCITYSELCTFNGKRYESIRKGCGSEDLCNKLFSISTNSGVTARIHTACCDKDCCNANLNFISKYK